jgi:hypothetical protein
MKRILPSAAFAVLSLSTLTGCNGPSSSPAGAVPSGGSDQGSMSTSDMVAAARDDWTTRPRHVFVDTNIPDAHCPEWFDLNDISVKDWKMEGGQLIAEISLSATTKQPIGFTQETPITSCLQVNAGRDIAVGEPLTGLKVYTFEKWASGWKLVPDTH